MGHDERGSPVVVQRVEQFTPLGSERVDRCRDHVVAPFVDDLLVQPPPSDALPGRIGTGSAGDRQQPVLRRPVSSISVQRGDRPLVRLLREVVAVVPVAEIPAQDLDVVLGLRHELLERAAITVLGVEQEAGQPVHRKPVCRGNQALGRVDRHIVESSSHSDDPAGAQAGPVSCSSARELVSASADDALDGPQTAVLATHLDGCVDCTAYQVRVAALSRSTRVRTVAFDPEFVTTVMQRAQPARLGRGGWLRPALAWCGLLIAFQSVTPLVFGDIDGAPTHVARHVGASTFALAVGLLYVAWRPHRAYGMLPLVGALFGAMLAGALFDMVGGDRSAASEVVHLVELVGMVLLWMIAGSPGWERFERAFRLGRGGGGVTPSTS